MKTEEKKNYEEAVNLFNTLMATVPDGTNLMAVIRAACVMIAECVIQGGLEKDEEDALLDDIGNKIRRAIDVLIEEDKKNGES